MPLYVGSLCGERESRDRCPICNVPIWTAGEIPRGQPDQGRTVVRNHCMWTRCNAYAEGAAVAFGIVGMFEAIREQWGDTACPICLHYMYEQIGIGADAMCWECHDICKRAHASTHPYR